MFALVVAVLQHRQFGAAPAEQWLSLEMGFGLKLMSAWRALLSSITPASLILILRTIDDYDEDYVFFKEISSR